MHPYPMASVGVRRGLPTAGGKGTHSVSSLPSPVHAERGGLTLVHQN